MGKSRMGVILRESVSVRRINRPLSDRAPEELRALQAKYNSFLKKLDSLVQALQTQKEVMILLDQAKSNVAEKILELSKKSPVSAAAGNYSYIHETVLEKAKFKAGKLEHFAIDYVSKWKRVVQERIVADTKATETKRINMEHYQRKVNALQMAVEKRLAKAEESNNKHVSQLTQEKFVRNVEKLDQEKQSYQQACRDLWNLMEECTDRGWRDLYPLLLKCAEFDMFSASDEANLLGSLKGVVSELHSLTATHGACAKSRLDTFGSAAAERISTKPRFSYFDDEEDTEIMKEESDHDCSTPAAANNKAVTTEKSLLSAVDEIMQPPVIEQVDTYEESDEEEDQVFDLPKRLKEEGVSVASNNDIIEVDATAIAAEKEKEEAEKEKEDDTEPDTSHFPDALLSSSFSSENNEEEEISEKPRNTSAGEEIVTEPVKSGINSEERVSSEWHLDQQENEHVKMEKELVDEDHQISKETQTVPAKEEVSHAKKTEQSFEKAEQSFTKGNCQKT